MAAEAVAVSMWTRKQRPKPSAGQRSTSSKEVQQQPEFDGLEEVMMKLLHAHRMFKLEMDDQWNKFQDTTLTLEQKLQALSQQKQQCRVTTAGLSIPEVAMAEDHMCGPDNSKTLNQVGSSNGNSPSKPEERLDNTPIGLPPVRVRTLDTLDINELVKEENEAFERVAREEVLQEDVSGEATSRCKRWMESPKFDAFVGIFILVNMLLIMFRMQYEGLLQQPGSDRVKSSGVEAFIGIAEHFLAAFFLLELVLRLLAHGFAYLRLASNMLDASVVVGSCVDSWLLPLVWGDAKALNLSLLRIFRLLKLMKVLRVLRVVKVLSPLRVLLHAVFSSISALAWSLLLLLVLQIIAAVLLAQTLQSVIKDETYDIQLREKVWNSFGTMLRAWLTTFEMTMAPGAFLQHSYLFNEVSPVYTFLILAYVCLVTFATIRVITALFLRTTLSAAERDAELGEEYVKMQRLAYSKLLCTRLEEAEGAVPGQGRIDKKGLGFLMTHKQMNEWLDDAGLDAGDVDRLFNALDLGNGTAFLSQFLTALSQISDRKKDGDTILHYESAKVMHVLSKVHEQVQQIRKDGVSSMYNPVVSVSMTDEGKRMR